MPEPLMPIMCIDRQIADDFAGQFSDVLAIVIAEKLTSTELATLVALLREIGADYNAGEWERVYAEVRTTD